MLSDAKQCESALLGFWLSEDMERQFILEAVSMIDERFAPPDGGFLRQGTYLHLHHHLCVWHVDEINSE